MTHFYRRINDNRIQNHKIGTDTDTDTGTGTSGGDGTNTVVINYLRLRLKNNHTASIMGCAVLCCAVLRNNQSQFHTVDNSMTYVQRKENSSLHQKRTKTKTTSIILPVCSFYPIGK
mmetsp:Transcript_2142/g.2346  ORF Transcript_2142/g.2346 Transcript_2142/m.2346 type:complete len:117 (-) Transcript_2142:70-420(-)